MGYDVEITTKVKIPVSKEKAVKKAFKDLAAKASSIGGGYSGGKKQFSFVDPNFEELDTVEEMFEAWRYSVKREENYFIVEYFEGSKLGDDDLLWKALESLVTPDSTIEFSGQEDTFWKYTFKNNKLKEVGGEVHYEDEEEEIEEPKSKKQKKVTTKDHYKVLGVTSSSTKEDINKAYKKEAKKYHPDNFSNLGEEFEEIATLKMQELNTARDFCLKKAKG